jgi:hypothetical protein
MLYQRNKLRIWRRRIERISIYLIQASGGLVMYSWYFINYLNAIPTCPAGR